MRFTIRDLLWLMVMVGLIVGWWVDHRSHDMIGQWRIMQTKSPLVIVNENTGSIASLHDDGSMGFSRYKPVK